MDSRGPLNEQNITQPLGGDSGGDRRQLRPGVALAERYFIQEAIGIGGMGAVYRARDLHFPNVTKLVAVKEMVNTVRDPLVRPVIVQNFEREANLLATLSHPAIPRIYDYFVREDRLYLILEFVHGKDLEAIINETSGFLTEDQVLAWAVQLCDVLAFLHKHQPDPIIFRDMKPSNIMIDTDGAVKLVDFGIARTFQVGQRGTMIGTEGYSPPEQYRGEATPSTDLYALGATLHHALTRRDPRLEPPFSFGERPVRRINSKVSPELETVITTALSYDPADRFPDAETMKEALLGVARKTGALSKLAAPAAVSSGSVKPLWSFECEDEVRGTPTIGDGAVYVGCYDNNLYALSAGDGKFLWKFATEGGIVSRPALHEGKVLFGSEDRLLYAVSALSGKLVWTYPTRGPIHSSARIAEEHVFIGSDDGGLHAVNISASRQAWTVDTGDKVRSTPFVAHDLIYVGTESGEFLAIDYRGEVRWHFLAKRAITSSPAVSDEAVFFASLDGNLYCLDARQGWVIWRFRLGKGSVSSPAIVENYCLVGSADGFIYCVDVQSGKMIWRFQTEHQVSSSPAIYRDCVYCGSVDGKIYCLEYRTGRPRWKFETGGPITGSAATFDDFVYVGSTDHHVYAFLA